ncbi:MAG: DUF2723 domain-containing protein, partial [bacterium]|nr:DUF2723 domain-containing protein [bacterium]
MPPTVFWQDSGIYLAGLKHFGIIYPPGFPLYMLLGVLWIKTLSLFPLGLNFTQQVHAFSGFWGAGAAALVGFSVYELIQQQNPPTAGGSEARQDPERKMRQDPSQIIISIISGISAGLSYSLWAQSINAEVYSLMGFFSALIFFLVIKFIKNYPKPPFEEKNFICAQKTCRKYLFLLALTWGFSFGVHLLTISFLIPLLWFSFDLRLLPVFKAKVSGNQQYLSLLPTKAWLLAFVIFLFAALTPYLYLPIRSAANPQVMWAKID